jgi:N6-L-threonylcarbamoyladenine synthase
LRDKVNEDPDFIKNNVNDLCASFQYTLIEILMEKLLLAVKDTGIKEVAISGGVSANSGLRDRIFLEGKNRGWKTYIPEFKFTTDNAAMIAITGYYKFKTGYSCKLDVTPISRSLDYA